MTEYVMIDRGLLVRLKDYMSTERTSKGERLHAELWLAMNKAPQQAAEPVAWISIVQCVGPDYGKELYGKLPAQSLQPGYYRHVPVYAGQPPAQPEQPAPIQTGDFERGALTAIALIIRCHDAESLAFDILNEMGLNGADCSELDECDKEDLSQLIGYRGAKLRGLTRPAAPDSGDVL